MDKDGLCPSASQPEGRKQSACERRKVAKGEMETENKALLLSHSLKLCAKNQTPVILEKKLLRILFYPGLLRTEPVCIMHLPEQTVTQTTGHIPFDHKEVHMLSEALGRMAAGVFTLYF